MSAQTGDVSLVGLPCLGNVLPGGIGEKVAVMEIHHQGQSGLGGPAGQPDDIVFPAPAALGIDPDPEADGVDSDILENVHDVGVRTALFLEGAAVVLHFGNPADVRAFGKGGNGNGGVGNGLLLVLFRFLAAAEDGEGDGDEGGNRSDVHV